MGSIAEIEGQLDSDLNLSAVAPTAADAVACLARIGDALRFLNRANVFCRVVLGRKLQLIQERHLWDRMERPAGDEQKPADGPYHSWDDFMCHGFPRITGWSPRIGYAALTLANSPTLRKLPEPELRKFDNLSNAFQLVKLERKGVVISQKLIAAAQTFSIEAFREMAGFGKKASVEVLVDGSDAARRLQWILNFLKMADPDSLLTFQEVLQNAMLQADGNASDALDCIIAACVHQWRQEGLPELAAVRP
jgi:hypothetical protein